MSRQDLYSLEPEDSPDTIDEEVTCVDVLVFVLLLLPLVYYFLTIDVT